MLAAPSPQLGDVHGILGPARRILAVPLSGRLDPGGAPLTCCTSRIPRHRMLRRPGTMAGLAWIMGFAAVAMASPGVVVVWTFPGATAAVYWRDWWFLTWFDLPRAAGYTVALAWITLALSGRFEADGGWQDRLGTLLGSCWIGLGFLSLLASWLSMF